MFILSKSSTDLSRDYWKATANTYPMARDALVHKVRLDAASAPWPLSAHLHVLADELEHELAAPYVAGIVGPWEYAIEFQTAH